MGDLRVVVRDVADQGETLARLNEIFRNVFLDDALTVAPETSAKDVDGWDSLAHVTLIVNVEKAFNIRFKTSEIAALKNVGELVQLVDARLRQKG
jgi:acyl carrier protein